jgi:hypothetical protein
MHTAQVIGTICHQGELQCSAGDAQALSDAVTSIATRAVAPLLTSLRKGAAKNGGHVILSGALGLNTALTRLAKSLPPSSPARVALETNGGGAFAVAGSDRVLMSVIRSVAGEECGGWAQGEMGHVVAAAFASRIRDCDERLTETLSEARERKGGGGGEGTEDEARMIADELATAMGSTRDAGVWRESWPVLEVVCRCVCAAVSRICTLCTLIHTQSLQ